MVPLCKSFNHNIITASSEQMFSSLVLSPFQQWQVTGPVTSSCTSGMMAITHQLGDAEQIPL